MKLATYSGTDGDCLGIVVGNRLIDLSEHVPDAPRQMSELIRHWDRFSTRLAALPPASAGLPLEQVRLRAPIPRPGKVMAIGLNYKDHIAEANIDPPKTQLWFSKMSTCVNGPNDRIALPAVSQQLDYEAELVVIVGKRVRGISRERAKDAIFGYCIGNDVSVRDWQFHGGQHAQFVLGKSFDTHGPIGPWITTSDEADARNLDLRCLVNGEVRQSSNTRHLLFDVYAQIEHLSQAMTLEPGDVIFTGTPGGVGVARKPPVFLRAGDVVRVEIESLGHIENTVTAEPAQGFAE